MEDRISRLPDSLIHHIMSFIDTKYAVQTCVLSKRWKPVWESLPFLRFNRTAFSHENTKRFIDFVYMVFLCRDDSTVQKFSVVWLNTEYNCSAMTDVNRWILNALKYDVQEISLWITDRHDMAYEIPRRLLNCMAYEIPHRLLNCKSLRKLEMKLWSGVGIFKDIILPRSMSLHQLKVLILDGLSISNVESYERLFSGCPVLENLVIDDCGTQTDNQPNLTVDSLSLQKFECVDCEDLAFASVIKFCAPNLKDFTFNSFWNLDFSLENCSSLSRVSLGMFLSYEEQPLEETDVCAKRMVKYLGAVYMVKELSLASGVLQVLSQALDISDSQPPCLCNLERLTLDMWITRSSFRSVAHLLSMSPNIASITLTFEEPIVGKVQDDWEAGLSLPGMLSQLKSIQIKEVEGRDVELKLLSFLLKNAKVLENVVFFPCSYIDSPDRVREQFRDKLRALPRASSRIRMHWPTPISYDKVTSHWTYSNTEMTGLPL